MGAGEIGVGDEHLAVSICEWLLFALAGRADLLALEGRTLPRRLEESV